MRLLLLTPEVPDPQGGGGAIRTLQLTRRLVERGHQVHVMGPASSEQADRLTALTGDGLSCSTVVRPTGQVREALQGLARRPVLAAAAVREPWLALQAGVFWTSLRQPVLAEIVSRRPDAVLVEHDFAARWAEDLPVGLPAALVLHNATWQLYADMAQVRQRALSAAYRLEALRYRAFVRRASSRYSLATAVSEADRTSWSRLASAPAIVVPNGVDVARFGSPAPPPSNARLLFTGTLSYPPNAEAVLWFSEHVLPRIRRAVPTAELTVVGRGAPPSVSRLDGRDGVRVVGWVEDVRPYFEQAGVVVAPLRTGGGTKLKVLEALAAQRPLVATRVATAGIDVVDREHVLEADEPAAFADAVVGLLRSAEQRDALARAGRRLVEARYDWRICGDALSVGIEHWLAGQ